MAGPQVASMSPASMRWADVYVSGLGPRDAIGRRLRTAPAISPAARCDGPTSTSACWPTVLASGIVALRGRRRDRRRRDGRDDGSGPARTLGAPGTLGSEPRDDEQRVGLALDAMGRRLRLHAG